MKLINLKRKATFVLLILTLTISALGLYFVNQGNALAEIVLISSNVKSEYVFGETIDIPEGEVSVEGESQIVQPTVFMPSGKAKKAKQITLNEVGEYILEYSTVKNGKYFSVTDSFRVYNYILSNTTTNAPLIYKNVSIPKIEQDDSISSVQIDGLAFSIKNSEMIKSNMILDLSSATKDDVAISIEANTVVAGMPDARELYIRFTDVYDESNYITAKIRRCPDVDGEHVDYSTVWGSFGTQPYLSYLDGTPQEHANWGVGLRNGMLGSWAKAHSNIDIHFDYKEKALYVPNDSGPGLNMVINFQNDFNTPWAGFTTGEVYLSIWASAYESVDTSKTFDGIIQSIFSKDITAGLNENDNAPLYKVEETKAPLIEFGEYENQNNIPNAMVGHPYKIFDSYGYSTFVKQQPIVKVFYGYNSSSRYALDIKDGKFVPIHDGIHTIEYTVKDIFGNTAIKLVDVYAQKDEGNTFEVSVNGYENYNTGRAGEIISLPAFDEVITSGNLGKVNINVIAEHVDGTQEQIENYLFAPKKGGEWTIVYNVTDAVERRGEFSFNISIIVDDAVVFKTIKDLNKYAIVNAINPIPSLGVIDYNLGGSESVAEKVFYQKDGSSKVEITEGYFIPTQAGDYSIIYQATSSKNHTSTKTFSVKAIDVGFPSKISMDKYFYSEAIVSSQVTDDNVLLTVQPNQAFEFIRPVNGSDFFINFNLPTESTANAVDIYLTDINNAEQAIKLSFSRGEDGVVLAINDGSKKALTGLSFNGSVDFPISINAGRIIINENRANVETYLNGDEFNGFDSQLVNLKICLRSNSSGAQGICINEISEQKLTNVTEDYISPAILSNELLVSRALPNEIVKIPSVKIIDVLDPCVRATISVYTPNGDVAKDESGNLLENVSIDNDYYVKASIIGTYIVMYNFADSAGNGGAQQGFRVISRERPIIDVDTENTTGKLKKEANIREAKVTSVSQNVKLYIFIQRPGETLKELAKTEKGDYKMNITLDVKGRYLVRYLAVDEWNNTSIADYFITVS